MDNHQNQHRERRESGIRLARLAGFLALGACLLLLVAVVIPAKFGLLLIFTDAPIYIVLLALYFISREMGNHSPRRLFLYSVIGLVGAFYAVFVKGVISLMAGQYARGAAYLFPLVPAVLFLVGCVQIKRSVPPRGQDDELSSTK